MHCNSARVIRAYSGIGMLKLTAVLFILVLPILLAGPSPVENRLLTLVNRERAQHGRNALEWDEKLAEAARDHSRRMAQTGFFGHDDPKMGSLRRRLETAGIRRAQIAENLHRASGYDDPAAVAVEGWLRSPGHRRNLLDGAFTLTGIGTWRGRDGTWYATQLFAR